jgi:glycine/serine hydroxymethyltransferase
MQTITAIAVALEEAKTHRFKDYATQSLKNAQVMASALLEYGYHLIT